LVLALAIAGVFALGLGAMMRGLLLRADHFSHSYEHSYEHESGGGVLFDESFDVSPGALLVVKVSNLDVAISSHESRQVEVVLRADDDEEFSGNALEAMGFSVERTSEGIEISTDSESRGHRDDLDGTLHITVPTRFDVQVQTGDGDVSVESIEGVVMLRTGDGDIALGGAMGAEVMIQTGDGDVAVGATVSRQIMIQTGDGDVALGRLEAEEVQVRTGDGDILIEELSGALRASTGDGDVMLHIREFAGVQITTGDGDVTLYVPADLAADVSIVGEELFLGEAFALPAQLEGRKIEGLLNGGGPELSVRVGDGTIRLIER
jgi:nitrogen regulatory protein PII